MKLQKFACIFISVIYLKVTTKLSNFFLFKIKSAVFFISVSSVEPSLMLSLKKNAVCV